MNSPEDLISLAEYILNQSSTRPSQTALRRSVSTVYYSLFHTLVKTNADLLTAKTKSSRSQPAWQQAYRGLEHGSARKACEQRAIMEKFPQSIQRFGAMFVEMQQARNKADYDSHSKFSKSLVKGYIDRARKVTRDFNKASVKDRNAFCVYVLFISRK